MTVLRERGGWGSFTGILTYKSADAVREAGHTLLRKPVKPAALRALVNRVLSRRSAA